MDCRDNEKFEAFSNLSSDEYEKQIKKAYIQKQPIAHIRLNLNVESLIVPKLGKLPRRQVEFTDTQDSVKSLLYRALVAAYNYTFFNEFAPLSAKQLFSRAAPFFIDWLNEKTIQNKYKLLKEYEEYWFDVRDNHGGTSPLIKLRTLLFNYAYAESDFTEQLSEANIALLHVLNATKISVQTIKKQISLASYFGVLPWLRDEHLGVGPDIYRTFASPKLTLSSLKALSATVILEFYDAKVALRNFLLAHETLQEDIRETLVSIRREGLNNHDRSALLGKTVYDILAAYHDVEYPSVSLQMGMSLFVISSLSTKGQSSSQMFVRSKEAHCALFKDKRKVKVSEVYLSVNRLSELFSGSKTGEGPMLSMLVIHQLSQPGVSLPITQVEQLMYSWLMASLAVQPNDINKLNQNHFRLFKIGQRVTNIECEYFKSRANAIHTTRSISTKNLDGKALLTYLKQIEGEDIPTCENVTPAISPGSNAILGSLANAMELPNMDVALRKAHCEDGNIPMCIPMAIHSLIRHGISVYNKKGLTNKQVKNSKNAIPTNLFGPLAIKNSAVHAHSDPYTLHYLINYNSHTNQTEKTSYLTEDNEEWINAAGRITRSVILDLINNVFDIDFSPLNQNGSNDALASFNNEFESVTQSVSYKCEEMLARLQIVTKQQRGRVNEVGVLSHSSRSQDQFAPIYVLDSSVTVCNMRNYLHEFKRNYRQLLSQNPDYLYQTVLPTAEWMQRVLSTELCPESITGGDKLFEAMQDAGVSMQVFHSI